MKALTSIGIIIAVVAVVWGIAWVLWNGEDEENGK